jgi:hypothetical protein
LTPVIPTLRSQGRKIKSLKSAWVTQREHVSKKEKKKKEEKEKGTEFTQY